MPLTAPRPARPGRPPGTPALPAAGAPHTPPGPARRRGARQRWLAVVALLAVLSPTGCGTPPQLRNPPPTPSIVPSRTATPTPAATPTAAPTTAQVLPGAGALTPTADAGLVAVPCRSGPSGQRVVDLVRGRGGVLPGDVRVRVRTGPLCAADWHYTVLDVTGHEELQVVTRNTQGSLRLVTAGTDVCTVEVRVAGPPGIRTLACEAGPVGVPGA